MGTTNGCLDSTTEFRRQAEGFAREHALLLSQDVRALSPEDVQKMLHELWMHQVELEIQNEELRRAHADLKEVRERYFDLMSEISELIQTKEALQKALTEVHVLHGMLHICAWCKKIRDDEGCWNQLEAYIEEHSEAIFSHGICPECAVRLRQESEHEVCSHEESEACETNELDMRLAQNDGATFWVYQNASVAQHSSCVFGFGTVSLHAIPMVNPHDQETYRIVGAA